MPCPDVVVVATDANCKGFVERARAFSPGESGLPLVLAIPDPHVERWLLLDGGAFRAVLGRGCDAPDRKCDRDRYKRLLVDAVLAAKQNPVLDGIEFAEEIAQGMDMGSASRVDKSFGRFVADMRSALGRSGGDRRGLTAPGWPSRASLPVTPLGFHGRCRDRAALARRAAGPSPRRVAIAASIGLSLRARDLAGRVREVRDREDGGMVVMRGSRHGALGPVPFGRAQAVSFDFGRPGWEDHP